MRPPQSDGVFAQEGETEAQSETPVLAGSLVGLQYIGGTPVDDGGVGQEPVGKGSRPQRHSDSHVRRGTESASASNAAPRKPWPAGALSSTRAIY